MNRSTFFQRLGLFFGASLGINPFLSSASEETDIIKPDSTNFVISKNSNRGLEPILFDTPWKQKVSYDRFTYVDMQTGEWIKEGLPWSRIEELQKELNKISRYFWRGLVVLGISQVIFLRQVFEYLSDLLMHPRPSI